jgi:transcriptional regulator with XRE-family HTH domain
MLLSYSETLPREIKAEMTRQDLSQMRLADRIGWSQGKLSKRLTGHVTLDLEDLEKIASALGADLKIEFYVSGRRGVRS